MSPTRIRTGLVRIQKERHPEGYEIMEMTSGKAFPATLADILCLAFCVVPDSAENHVVNIIRYTKLNEFEQVIRKLSRFPGGQFVSKKLLKLFLQTKYLKVNEPLSHSWMNEIAELKKKRLLVEDKELARLLYEYAAASKPVVKKASAVRIGIPTKNRPEQLKKLLADLLHNMQIYGAEGTVTVMDDSADPSVRAQNISLFAKLSVPEGVFLRYGNREAKAAFAKRLAKETGVSEEALTFCLTGATPPVPTGSIFSAGSSRNALLFDAVGVPSIQFDDDMRIQPRTLRGKKVDGLSLGDARQYWFQESFRSALEFGSPTEVNVAGALTEALGLHPFQLLARYAHSPDDVQIRDLPLDSLLKEDAKIAVAYAGAYGGSPMTFVRPSFFFGESLYRLTKNETAYRALMQPFMSQATGVLAVTSNEWCVGMNMAIDTREFVPFFTPVQTGEDTLFGALLWSSFQRLFSLHLPFLLLHDRQRESHAYHLEKSYFRTSTLLKSLVNSVHDAEWQESADALFDAVPEERLRRIGRVFSELSNVPSADFMSAVSGKITPYFHQLYLQLLTKYLGEDIALASYRKQLSDEILFLSTARDSINSSTHFLWDIPGERMERVQTFQHWLGWLGILLTNWSDLFRAAGSLKQKGISVSAPVTP